MRRGTYVGKRVATQVPRAALAIVSDLVPTVRAVRFKEKDAVRGRERDCSSGLRVPRVCGRERSKLQPAMYVLRWVRVTDNLDLAAEIADPPRR